MYKINLKLGLFTKHITSIDAKIKKTQAKMENPEGKVEIPSDFQEKIDSIDTEVKKLLRDIDYLGEIGRIDESERLYEEVERLKRTREDLVILAENPSLASKHMKVFSKFL